MGNFNQHDQLWGGNEILLARQGEAAEIIELIFLSSMLPALGGGETWKARDSEGRVRRITIDPVVASQDLTNGLVKRTK